MRCIYMQALTLVTMSIMTSEIVWFVKLPAEWKEIFEKLAEEEGDDEFGAGSRHVRKVLKKQLKEGSA